MSTKLFNGHEIIGHSLESFLQELKALQRRLQPLARAKIARVVLNYAVAAHDTELLGAVPALGKPYLISALDKVLDRIQEVERVRRRDPVVDMGFEVVLFPVEDRLLALTYCEQRDFLDAWSSHGWRRDFAFWDNTDAPEDLSSAEWEERGRLWSAALGDENAPPAECGLSFTLLSVNSGWDMFEDADLLPHLPRASLRARMVLTPLLLASLPAGDEQPQTSRELGALLRSERAASVLADAQSRLTSPIELAALR